MTLDIITRRIQYVGNDTTKCFSFPFRAWDTSQIRVYCFNESESWTETDITNQVTVSLNDDFTGDGLIIDKCFLEIPDISSEENNLKKVTEFNHHQTPTVSGAKSLCSTRRDVLRYS